MKEIKKEVPGASQAATSKPDMLYHIHNEKRETAPKQNGGEEKHVKISYKIKPEICIRKGQVFIINNKSPFYDLVAGCRSKKMPATLYTKRKLFTV